MLDIKDKILDISVTNEDGEPFDFKNLKNKKFVLYFYPKDDTPGCTKEALSFSDNIEVFKNLGYRIIGVSKDDASKHKKFIEKYKLNFTLVSDVNLDLCKLFNVWVEKSMYGKKYMGIERSTFLIHQNFEIIKSWSKVKVSGHTDEIVDYISN